MSNASRFRYLNRHRLRNAEYVTLALILVATIPVTAQPRNAICSQAWSNCISASATLNDGAGSSARVWRVLPRAWRNPFDPAQGEPGSRPPLLGAKHAAGSDARASNAEPQAKTNRAPAEKNRKAKGTYSSSPDEGSPGHIFWIVPAFKVNYAGRFKPLTAKEKFEEWAQNAYDPLGLGIGAVEAATLEYSPSDGFCGYGVGCT